MLNLDLVSPEILRELSFGREEGVLKKLTLSKVWQETSCTSGIERPKQAIEAYEHIKSFIKSLSGDVPFFTVAFPAALPGSQHVSGYRGLYNYKIIIVVGIDDGLEALPENFKELIRALEDDFGFERNVS